MDNNEAEIESNTKTERIVVRLEPSLLKLILRATGDDRSLSQWIREACNDKISQSLATYCLEEPTLEGNTMVTVPHYYLAYSDEDARQLHMEVMTGQKIAIDTIRTWPCRKVY